MNRLASCRILYVYSLIFNWLNFCLNGNFICKIPKASPVYWVILVMATAMGKIGVDVLLNDFKLGYANGILIGAFAYSWLVSWHYNAKNQNPYIYWLAIAVSTSIGIFMAYVVDGFLQFGYALGAGVLVVLLVRSLMIWNWDRRAISLEFIIRNKSEIYYWLTIFFAQSLGAALSDWTIQTAGLGRNGTAVLFSFLLACVLLTRRITKSKDFILFWIGFILTRPLGTVLGDYLVKPVTNGGLALNNASSLIILMAIIFALLSLANQRPEGMHH